MNKLNWIPAIVLLQALACFATIVIPPEYTNGDYSLRFFLKTGHHEKTIGVIPSEYGTPSAHREKTFLVVDSGEEPSIPTTVYGAPIKSSNFLFKHIVPQINELEKTFVIVPFEHEETVEEVVGPYPPPPKPATVYGPPKEAVISHINLPYVAKTTTFKTAYEKPVEVVVKDLVPPLEYGVPNIPVTSYGVPTAFKTTYEKPVEVVVRDLVPPLEYGLPKIPVTSYGVPVKQIPVPLPVAPVPFPTYELPKKPHTIYGVPL